MLLLIILGMDAGTYLKDCKPDDFMTLELLTGEKLFELKCGWQTYANMIKNALHHVPFLVPWVSPILVNFCLLKPFAAPYLGQQCDHESVVSGVV